MREGSYYGEIAIMRVAIFTNTYYPAVNGVANCVAAYREGLLNSGHEVAIFAPAPQGYDLRSDPDDIFRFPALPIPMDLDYSIAMPYSSSVFKALRGRQFDIVHTQHPVWVGAWGAWYARWNDLPLVTTVHTEYELFAPMVPLPTALVEMYLNLRVTSYCNKCQIVTTPAESTRRRLEEQGVTTPVEILPNPIRVSDFANVDGTKVRQALGISDDITLIGFVGRVSREKNLDVLIEAVSRVLREKDDAAFVLVGDGPELDSVKQQIRHMEGAERVFLTGGVPYEDIPPYQAAIDVMVTASLSETQPLAYTEAMATGTPIVGLCAPGAEDMIQTGVNGLLSEVEDGAAGLAEKVLELMDNPALFAKVTEGARQTAQQFDVAHVTDRLVAIYHRAIKLGGELPL